jgi:subtilisin family serine protease
MVRRQRYEKALAALVLAAIAMAPTLAEPSLWRVWFQAKPYTRFAPGDPLYERTLEQFAPEALQRRANHGYDPLLTIADAPIPPEWISAVTALGNVRVAVESRWWTYIVIETDTPTALATGALPMVRSITSAGSAAIPLTTEVEDCSPPDPGASRTQLDMLRLSVAHAAGAYGQGAIIGMIDNGFRWSTHEALRYTDVREEFDVIFGDSNTANEPGDHPEQDGHGTLTMSMIAGWRSGTILGAAPFAAFLLAKTEDARYERRVEMDNFVAGTEWLERRGADILTASVGYSWFDGSDAPVLLEDLDGHTTLAALALNEATARGMICLTAAGNGGPNPRTLITPGDADSAITVGAVRMDGTTALLSSSGPTADGRVKPDVCALGVQVVGATNASDTSYVASSGTSLSTPQVAGLAAVLRSICSRSIRSYEVREAIYRSTESYPVKDPSSGYGVPRFDAAAEILSPCITPITATPDVNALRVITTVFHAGDASTLLLVREHGSTREPDTIRPVRTFELHVIFELPFPQYDADTLDMMVWSSTSVRSNSWPHDTMHAVARVEGYTPCGASRQVISSVPLADQPSSMISPNPARAGDRVSLPLAFGMVSTIELIDPSGRGIATAETLPDVNGLAFIVPPCTPGLYLLRSRTSRSHLLWILP